MIKKSPLSNSKAVKEDFTVVAIGSSLGGLDAVSLFLKSLPIDTGLAYIYIQHLDPNHKSELTSILAKKTKMDVIEIKDMEHIVPNNFYVIPYDKIIAVTDGHIKLIKRPKNSSFNSIDVLFSSLADTHHEKVVGIILSGNAHDGTNGILAIKKAGGITFAQDKSAQAMSMPNSAIESGAIDFVLNPKEIALKIASLFKNGLNETKTAVPIGVQEEKEVNYEGELKFVFELLFKQSGIDFSHYKLPTIKRRINHKIVEHGFKTIQEYGVYLKANPKSIILLSHDLLINVSSFFRDSTVFNYLKKSILPKLINSKSKEEKIRIWVPACSTGEEAYSIAMLLSEINQERIKHKTIQIFASDLSDESIQKARGGIYSEQDVKTVPKKYLAKYFVKLENTYQIKKELRELIVFATHNILQDPPFSKMDFISCCNLLIYFDQAAQKRVFGIIHFALNDKGYVMLGKAETTGASSQLFNRINTKFKLYSKKKQFKPVKITVLDSNFSKSVIQTKKIIPNLKNPNLNTLGIERTLDSILLANYMPACVVINKELEIQQFRGPITQFLQHNSGKASLNILKMAHPEFVFELRTAIQHTIQSKETVKKTGIETKINNATKLLSFEVSLFKIDWEEPLFLVVFSFQNGAPDDIYSKKSPGSLKDKRILKLSEELSLTRSEMNSIIENQENTFEELQSANEEIVSSNEEFQTLNEELETSKEEIEASNEELILGNHELQIQNELLSESYEYSEAIIKTIHEPMLVLTKDFKVKSANGAFYENFQLKKEDTIDHLLFELDNKQWNIPNLKKNLKEIITKNKNFKNFEVSHRFSTNGHKTMQLNARRIIQKVNNEHLILLAIEDISIQKNIENELIEAKKIAEQAALLAETAKINAENLAEIAEIALKAKQQFLSNMSHEIRTPMNAIIGFTKVVLKTELSDKQQEYLNAIRISGEALITILNDILDFAKVGAGKMIFEQNPFQLKDSFTTMVQLFEEKIQEKELTFTTKYDKSIPELLVGDINRLNQILINLLNNATKFTSKGGIDFEMSLHSQTEHSVVIQFDVKDTGIGIPEDKLESVFESFQQGSSNTSRIFGGTGLGLAIVKQLVEIQSGKINVISEQDSGSSFSIQLEFKKATKKDIASFVNNQVELLELDSEIKNSKILVVEDIALNQLLMKTILHDFGFELDLASNGSIAIEMLQKNSYDLILMDLQMPEMNGFEATEYIRKKIVSDIPIIALTADVTSADLEKCTAVGMNDYVAKPIDEKILYEKISKLIKKSKV